MAKKKLKPIWFWGVLVIVVTLIVFGVHSYISARAHSAEEILPADVLVYAKVTNVRKNLKSFFATNLWSQFSKIDFDGVARRFAKPGEHASYKGQLADVETIIDESLFKKLIGQEVVAAVYPIQINVQELSALSKISPDLVGAKLLSNVYILSKVTNDVQFLESFMGYLNTKNVQGASFENTSYNGFKIHEVLIPSKGLKFCFVRFGNWLAAGFSEEAMKKLVDVYKKVKPSLASDRVFMERQASEGQRAKWQVFVNFEAVYAMVEQAVEDFKPMLGTQSKVVKENLKYFAGYQALALAGLGGDPDQIKIKLTFDRRIMHPDVAPFFDRCESREDAALSFIPQDVLAYHWDGCFNASKLWGSLKASEKNGKSGRDRSSTAIVAQTIKGNTGLDLESQILPAIGHEWGVYWNGVDIINYGNQKVPMPKLFLFVKMKQKKIFEEFVNKLETVLPFKTAKESYAGDTINAFQVPMGAGFQPAYCFKDDYFLLSLQSKVLKQSLDLEQKGQRLKDAEDFKALDKGLSNMGKNFDFIGVEKLLDTTKDLVSFGNDFVTRRADERAAFQKGTGQRLADYQSALKLSENQLLAAEADKTQDPAETARKMSAIKADIRTAQEKIKSAEEAENNMRPDNTPSLADRNYYLNTLVYPLIEALKNIKNIAIGESSEEDNYQWRIIFKVQ
ncbi:MAG: hypothetical protein HQL26_04975 [Candidatus Omnitrophica bacterium]|nr:hypothetical protein [Candidatus Omnitrophota bacterium]